MVADLLLCGVLSTARYRLGGGVRESVGGVKRPTLERGRSGKLTVNLLLFGVPRTTGDVGHATRSLIGMASRLLSLYLALRSTASSMTCTLSRSLYSFTAVYGCRTLQKYIDLASTAIDLFTRSTSLRQTWHTQRARSRQKSSWQSTIEWGKGSTTFGSSAKYDACVKERFEAATSVKS